MEYLSTETPNRFCLEVVYPLEQFLIQFALPSDAHEKHPSHQGNISHIYQSVQWALDAVHDMLREQAS